MPTICLDGDHPVCQLQVDGHLVTAERIDAFSAVGALVECPEMTRASRMIKDQLPVKVAQVVVCARRHHPKISCAFLSASTSRSISSRLL